MAGAALGRMQRRMGCVPDPKPLTDGGGGNIQPSEDRP